MELVEALTVEGTYLIAPNTLVIRPCFSVPEGGWAKRTEKILVVRPDGEKFDATAEIATTHLNIPDPTVPIEKRWRVTIWLTDRTEDEVPVGSKILASPEVRDALRVKYNL